MTFKKFKVFDVSCVKVVCEQGSDEEEFNLMLATVLDWTWLFTNR